MVNKECDLGPAVCFGYRRALINDQTFNDWGFIERPEYFSSTAAAARVAFGRQVTVRARSIVQPAGSAVLV
jgi:hypothetical protein